MTILSVLQQAAMSIAVARPSAVFSATAREMTEMQAVANEAASVIADAHDWQALMAVRTIAGDGVNEAFDLPADYRRMPVMSELWLSRTRAPAQHFVDLNQWLGLTVNAAPVINGVWSIFGGQIHVKAILRAGETARFFYMRNFITTGGKTAFDADGDVFVLDERLLKLCIIYLWKQQKGQDFTAELSDYEMALDQAKRRDGGSMPTLSGNTGAARRRSNVWPGTVSAG